MENQTTKSISVTKFVVPFQYTINRVHELGQANDNVFIPQPPSRPPIPGRPSSQAALSYSDSESTKLPPPESPTAPPVDMTLFGSFILMHFAQMQEPAH